MKRYEIETIEDLLKAAEDSKNIDGLLADLRLVIEQFISLPQELKDLSTKEFTWIDDDKREIVTTVEFR